ncbi:methyltransferase [Helicobacter saguini]|uniref:Methyltransferase n=1 Tax=Helicobacter saguini TaxID=1548018 RepID=A0A347VGL5_9HELI|nr:50S ribosomal protein L11 methyltransferase [Helicobacter saguini]MWV61943.1 methyltransferase [Helicobacter saguini]MWV67382.1 methyltransferase [Helicobacter saguini]MWV69735.1 methyltransferase [Helicobacter saguini]MWV73048.1 methyltransferase [Helicobacter saguini]TLD95577.1 50S ribosomal protein L11 methyltransferase [Helicobacter saguini]
MANLSYKIFGKKLDSNNIKLGNNNIIWRSHLDLPTILDVLSKINARVFGLLKELGLESSVDFNIIDSNHLKTKNRRGNIESRFYKSYKKANFYDNLLRDKFYKRLRKRDFRFFNKEFLKQKVRKNKTRFYIDSKFVTKHKKLENIESKSYKNFINTNIFLCENKNWVNEYQKSIKPVVCGNFYIRPSWSATLKSLLESNDITKMQNLIESSKNSNFIESKLIELIIDPSLSFGSGHHASTAMCINLLSNLHFKDSKQDSIQNPNSQYCNLKNKNMLDVGCGSGILSLVGAKLGANIYACDVDSFAISQTQKNFKINNLKYKKLWCGSITKDSNKYDIIVANIITSIILILKNELINNLKQNGILILSGILKEKENTIISNFSSLKLLESEQIDEWISFKFIKTRI